MTVIRPLTLDDVPALTTLIRENRDFLAPWEPERPESFFTEEGQHEAVAGVLAQDDCRPFVILDEQGEVAGRIIINGIVRGAFQSCYVGYWLAEKAGGRGLATRALREVIEVAFDELGLHRIQADTVLDNVRSQRMLERNGFVRYALAPTYLKIAGRWQDCYLHQLINPRSA
ncbi:GNAT family N-acetyltransferase [Nonomuraea sp. NPDC050328]|uniref:GNAT family N-acetyltransferase n=1 Tax=Nonomuraea sp. NPDC050328 TaxID=3364361 RepID=UPI00379AC439